MTNGAELAEDLMYMHVCVCVCVCVCVIYPMLRDGPVALRMCALYIDFINVISVNFIGIISLEECLLQHYGPLLQHSSVPDHKWG